jgi:D-alanyl-D-alanine carboxypeptidase/D-alanyl-D-alanine-endopeptidase (penicillin-binding protein 4)
VAASGSSQGPQEAVATLTGPSQEDAEAQAQARIKTYLALAKQSDRRNLDFLRTAWRTEKDPAVRAVVAEAIYQSNPQDYFGARALLESFAAGDHVYGRLRTLARTLKVEVPAVGSVVELASQGNQEAISRVLALSPAAQADAEAQDAIAEALSEIARTAPEELVLGLKAASAEDQKAAEALLAQGLGNEGAKHPFWPSVKKLSGSADDATARFAKAREGKLSVAIAEAKLPKALAASPVAVPTGTVVPASAKQPAQNDPAAEVRPGG